MKLIIPLLISAVILFAAPSLTNAGSSGHVAFYLFDSTDSGDASYGVEAANDFIYYYGKLEPWLKKNEISYSFHEERDIDITISPGRKVSFTDENFKGDNDIGMILIRPDGEYKMIEGVWIDVDLLEEIRSYFSVKSN